jgi:hypothetical protein
MKLLNRLLWWVDVQLVPAPPSVKSLIEYANALETSRPVGPSGAHWLRKVARVTAQTYTDRNSATVERFLAGR